MNDSDVNMGNNSSLMLRDEEIDLIANETECKSCNFFSIVIVLKR